MPFAVENSNAAAAHSKVKVYMICFPIRQDYWFLLMPYPYPGGIYRQS